MMYDNVEVVDYKSGLIKCSMHNSSTIKIYKESKELYRDLNIGRVNNKSYFTLISIYDRNKLFGKVVKSIVLNNRTLEEIFVYNGVIRFKKTICNGKYVIADSNSRDTFLFDINNNKMVISSNDGVEGLLEKVINKMGKGAFR